MSVKKQGFLQASGVFFYCFLIGLIMGNGNKLFGKVDNAFTPIFVLLLFSTSALVCTAIVFYKPYRLFTNDKKKEALDTVIATALWLFAFLFIFTSALLIFK
jgi:hypothetical protein